MVHPEWGHKEVIRLKDTTRLKGLQSEMVVALDITDSIYLLYSISECWVTSACDGVHEEYSPHYQGRAVDIRTHNVDPAKLATVQLAIQEALGPEFQVILEDKGGLNEHFHVQSGKGGPDSGAPQ